MGEDTFTVVTVEQDLNTLTGEIEQRRFNVEKMGSFFKRSVEEANDILRKFFP